MRGKEFHMKKVLIFEHTEHSGAFEKEFYNFCLRRQLSLIRFMPINALYSVLYFFRVVSKRTYYEKRWSFLGSVKDLESKIKSYWDKRKNSIGRIAAGEDIVWISEYPKNLLSYPAESVNAGLRANDYDIAANAFPGYKDVYDLYLDATGGRAAIIYDSWPSGLVSVAGNLSSADNKGTSCCKNNTGNKSVVSDKGTGGSGITADNEGIVINARTTDNEGIAANGRTADNKGIAGSAFKPVYNQRAFDSIKEYRSYKIRNAVFTWAMLLLMGIFIGLTSLYFGAAYFKMPMFLSYFKIFQLPLLNILPVVFCIFLMYLIFNRVWVSFLITAVATMLFTWINYFKLLIRNDPLLAADLVLASEAANMVGIFKIDINWEIILAIICCILGVVFSAAMLKRRIHSGRLRLAGIAILILIGVFSFNNIYMSDHVYSAAKNYDLINRWSATEVYISRGFVYPFIYSIKSSVDKKPEGYNEKEAEDLLYSYGYSDIEDDKKVNIISIMLESYNDFSKFGVLDFNVDVYRYWHELQKESYSGELVTNIFVGGTVDTERCFLTGYTALFNFRRNVNSYVHYFREQGYTVEGSHPCYGWFYNRQNVNKYLGFDNYYFYENLYSELSGGKIADDDILFPQIIKLYEENKKENKPYFSFNVTYQNHGPYPADRKADTEYVKNKGYTEEEYNILNNYIEGIYHTNRELEQFIDYFRNEEKPVVIILFGDHNPWLGDNNSVYSAMGVNFDLSTEEGFYNYYNTPYIIWANESAKQVLGNDFAGKGPIIGPYFLMNVFFDLAGYGGNEYMKFSNDVRKIFDIIHLRGYYKEKGTLAIEASPEYRQMLDDFIKVQHYWRNNFRSDKP